MKEVYIDGTKIKTNANPYTFFWGRAIKTSTEKITRHFQRLWNHAKSLAREESENNESDNFEKIDAKKVKQTIDRIDKALENRMFDKEVNHTIGF